MTQKRTVGARRAKKNERTHRVEQPADCTISTAAQYSELGNVFIELESARHHEYIHLFFIPVLLQNSSND